ncbi:uncharacterized protein LOC106883426 [Octopus bimaculoides]|uniref:Uncharacterized protein n=1 Tax=Octopus bimaculoides TaxID=37653 RepID=A0A0L8FGY3_OCTBM|nr:uncharacterized protein LOC106883426 [Octopus bimaculoides]|eukprot:XP_014789908.1 PREDICTED: uncharacterized protein LOC106883426 [Octopus bimaculoides]
MGGRQLSTALSDFFLALSAYFVAVKLKEVCVIAGLGIFIQGMAASIGVARFSMEKPYKDIIRAHMLFSLLATFVGIPLLSIGFCIYYHFTMISWILSAVCFFAITFSFFMDSEVKRSISEPIAGLAIIIIIALCLYHENLFGFLACIIYILSGVMIGSEGAWFGILRIDLLHYTLVLGNLAFYKSFT